LALRFFLKKYAPITKPITANIPTVTPTPTPMLVPSENQYYDVHTFV
jgi:hypothetical protein